MNGVLKARIPFPAAECGPVRGSFLPYHAPICGSPLREKFAAPLLTRGESPLLFPPLP